MKIMLRTCALSAIALFSFVPCLLAQEFDFKTLDKLGVNAKSSTNLTLNANILKMAAAVLGSDDDKDAGAIKSVVENLKGIYIRSYEFDKPGEYVEADLAPLRAFLNQPKWTNIVDVRDRQESTQLYFLEIANNKLGGVALLSTEPTSLTVVYIDGELNRSDLEKLSGNMGIPDIPKLASPKTDNKTDNKKTGK
jgi:hypothetical protein